MEEDKNPNPLIPILFQNLQDIKLSAPLTDEESAYFFQVLQYIDSKVQEGAYPPEFSQLVTEPIKNLAKKRYTELDNCQHEKWKEEMGKN